MIGILKSWSMSSNSWFKNLTFVKKIVNYKMLRNKIDVVHNDPNLSSWESQI